MGVWLRSAGREAQERSRPWRSGAAKCTACRSEAWRARTGGAARLPQTFPAARAGRDASASART
eukprot:1428852-Pyramimonas_sp.AAC.1